ncbi:hypothetical protein J6590_022560 [Homalodisca vitripennis]|nr:hypothetical protein J6590_022560 [Homalodisca vitripennis]
MINVSMDGIWIIPLRSHFDSVQSSPTLPTSTPPLTQSSSVLETGCDQFRTAYIKISQFLVFAYSEIFKSGAFAVIVDYIPAMKAKCRTLTTVGGGGGVWTSPAGAGPLTGTDPHANQSQAAVHACPTTAYRRTSHDRHFRFLESGTHRLYVTAS